MACKKIKGEYKRKKPANRTSRRPYRISDVSRIAAYVEGEGYEPAQIIAACIYNTSFNQCLYDYALNNQDIIDKIKTLLTSSADVISIIKEIELIVLGLQPNDSILQKIVMWLGVAKVLAKKIAGIIPLVGSLISVVQEIQDVIETDCCEQVLIELIAINQKKIDVEQPLIENCASPNIKNVDLLK